ncbi:GNAT family N-acetyltransferase [Phenylobacterium sp.]|uniref:GNAT family N-acetyltransferase n=1 Tax=Phenylobacterium sp. TaxID=1871053 RepID=UPI0037C70FB3
MSTWLQDDQYRLWAVGAPTTGVAVGYAVLCPVDLPVPSGPMDLELKRIYLLSRYQGGGVGALLLASVIAAATGAGATRLLLGVYGENHPARAFYARQGFTQAGVRQFRVGANVYDDLVLERPLR